MSTVDDERPPETGSTGVDVAGDESGTDDVVVIEDELDIPPVVPQVLIDEVAAADAEPAARPRAAARFAGRDRKAFVRHVAVFAAFGLALAVWPGIIGDPTRVRQFGEYLCYAAVAVGIDIAWGYGKMLTLGQGVFFGLGAYAMGMYLSLAQVKDGAVPEFMALYSDYTELPAIWKPFNTLWFVVPFAVLAPALLAGALGWLVFTRRIRGPFFAILTQATALVFWLLLIGQQAMLAGTNGLTKFTRTFGIRRNDPAINDRLYLLAAVTLFVVLVVAWQFVRSRMGRLLVATRDSEDRVRFLGYDPAAVKTIAFATSAAMAGIAGAVAAAVIGQVNPDMFTVLPSILMVCWVAVGGRGTLWGAVLGAIAVSWGRTAVSETWPSQWIYVQGLLFIVVLGFSPRGLAGMLEDVWDRRPWKKASADSVQPPLAEVTS
jgi:urea transport system permease protein